MNFIIAGCGRVGAMVATTLDKQGHKVAITDINKDAFKRLGNDFGGTLITGVAFDKTVLKKANVSNADGYIAVTSGDNTNIIASRVAKTEYKVKNVIARIYDSGRADLYAKLGIATVSPSTFGANEILRTILSTTSIYKFLETSEKVALNTFSYSDGWIGLPVSKIDNLITEGNVAYISRSGEAFVPTPNTKLNDLDVLNIIFNKSKQKSIQSLLNKNPNEKNT